MIKINTYIGRKELETYEENKSTAEAFFVPVTSEEALTVIRSISSQNIDRGLNGAIVIQVDQNKLTTLSDWDDLDLLWTGLVTMGLDYFQNGGYGASYSSINGLEWSIKKVGAKPVDLLLFHTKRPNTFYDGETGTSASIETKVILMEMEFLHKVFSSAGDFLSLREKDTRTQNLAEFKEKYKELKHLFFEK